MKVLEIFDNQIKKAIDRYGDDHIDIIVQEEEVYGGYHSRHNSFRVTDVFSLEELGGIDDLKKYEIEFEDLCVCEA